MYKLRIRTPDWIVHNITVEEKVTCKELKYMIEQVSGYKSEDFKLHPNRMVHDPMNDDDLVINCGICDGMMIFCGPMYHKS